MENFIFALNATIPIFLIIVFGFFLQKIQLLNDSFNKIANEYVFKCALPISLFRSMAGMDFYSEFDWRFCLFCFWVTTAIFLGVWAAAWLLMKDKSQIGAFAQATARSNSTILGISLAVNIYGDAGMVPMMVMVCASLSNVYSVLILSFSPHVDSQGRLVSAAHGSSAVKAACINVLKNPLIIGLILGVSFALLPISVPTMLDSALQSIGATATPLALLMVGASFSGKEALTRWKGAVVSTFIRLFLLPGIFLPLAVALGFRDSALVAIFIMVGAPTAVASYVMAKGMHADSVLTSNAILLSTIVSSVSITLWLYLLRSFQLI